MCPARTPHHLCPARGRALDVLLLRAAAHRLPRAVRPGGASHRRGLLETICASRLLLALLCVGHANGAPLQWEPIQPVGLR